MSDPIAAAFPLLGERLPKMAIADLPTPVSTHTFVLPRGNVDVAVKHDEATSKIYGGNKVRKLEYLLQRATDRGAHRVATFGAAGSNHALATAVHAAEVGLECTCFLSHQKATPNIARVLNMHRRLGTEIVCWSRSANRLDQYRKYLQNRNTWVIPLGGTCWLGAVGFVNAGLELAQQIDNNQIPYPDRIYIASGTTGSAAGLVLGLVAAGLDTVVHAIKVADNPFASYRKLRKLISKTEFILRHYDPTFAARDWERRLVWRDEFLAGGYAKVDDATADAVAAAASQLGLSLETTYTGKAMAAMLHDVQQPDYAGENCLFWNTYNACALPVSSARPATLDNIPVDFARYYAESQQD